MTPEQQKALAVAQARRRRSEAEQPQAPEGFVLDPSTGQMVDTKKIAEEQNTGFLGKLGAFGGAAFKGVPIVGEWLDEAIGATAGPVPQAVARERVSQFEQEYPKTAMAGKVGATLSAAVPMAMGGASFAAGAQTLPRTAMGLGVDGAIMGAAAGAGAAEGDMDERARQAMYGGVTGGVVGSSLPVIGSAVSNTVGPIVKPAIERAMSSFQSGPTIARNKVAQVLRDQGMNPSAVQAQLNELGPEAALIDVLGDGGHRLARAAANASPSAKSILRDTLAPRAQGRPDRVIDALKSASGLKKDQSPKAIAEALRAQERPKIDAAYNAAREAGFDLPNEPFRALTELKPVKKALRAAEDAVKARSVISGQDAGSKLAVYDEAKRILDDKASVAFRKGARDKGGVASALARKLRETVDDSVPEYGGARALAQAVTKREKAVELGAGLGKSRVSLDMEDAASKLEAGLRPDMAKGYAGQKIEDVLNRRGTPGSIDALFGSPMQQRAASLALGDKSGILDRRIAAERLFGESERAFAGNSTTAQQLNDMGVLAAGKGGLVERAFDAIRKEISSAQDAKVAPEVVKILLGRDLTGASFVKLEKHPALQRAVVNMLSIAANDARETITAQ